MGCFTPDTPNVASTYQQAIGAQAAWSPYLASAQSALAPIYGNMGSAGIASALTGSEGGTQTVRWSMPDGQGGVRQRSVSIDTPASPGLISLYENQLAPMMSRTATATNSVQRAADINDLSALAPLYRSALRASDPQSTRLLDTLTNQAQSDLELGSYLNPGESRLLAQSARSAQAARGMGMGPRDSFEEVLRQVDFGRQLQNDRRSFASNVLNQNMARYGDTVQGILGRQSGAGAQAQGFLGQASALPGAPDLNRNTQDMGGALFNAKAASEIAHTNANASMASY